MVNSRETRSLRHMYGVVVVLVIGFALWPAFSRTHLEGFTYFVETMSILQDATSLDPLWSVNDAFFYLSRPGMVWAMVPFSALSPGNGYALLMGLATPLFLSGAVIVARCVSGASWAACLGALLAVPITIEAHFFFNDNVLANALSLWAMVLLFWSRKVAVLFAAGALYSAAILVRLDQVLLAPYFALLVFALGPNWRSTFACLAAAFAGFAAIHGAFALLDPTAANPLARIAIAARADALWDRSTGSLLRTLVADGATASLAFGLGLPAIVAGACVSLRARQGMLTDARRAAVVLLYPVFIYALTLGKYYDPRAFLILVPFLLPLAALGLDRWVFKPLSGVLDGRPLMAALLLAPIALPGVPLLHSLPYVAPESESPVPTMTGRIWYPGDWRAWQDAEFKAPDREIARLVETVAQESADTLILSTLWTSDRRLQNALAVAGFKPVVPESRCAEVSEVWASPTGATVTHVRAHVPFFPRSYTHSAALFLTHAQSCLQAFPPDRRIAIWPHGAIVNIETSREPLLTQRPDGFYQVTDEDIETLARLARETLNTLDGAPSARELFDSAKQDLNAAARKMPSS
ncbi:MAG: hypothetical protein AAGA15_11070 [Pseudomonadota bacterium]